MRYAAFHGELDLWGAEGELMTNGTLLSLSLALVDDELLTRESL
jgi:hypothetical protein